MKIFSPSLSVNKAEPRARFSVLPVASEATGRFLAVQFGITDLGRIAVTGPTAKNVGDLKYTPREL